MTIRKSTALFLLLGLLVLAMTLLFAHGALTRGQSMEALGRKAELVKRYGLTDLCLFTDARYTRHPSMADLNTPFQDYPLSFEHFPSGSLLSPPPHITGHELD